MTKSTTSTEKRTKGRKRIAILITSAVLVAAGSGAAFAYWTSQGTGSGTASTGTSAAFTVTSTAATGSPLSPGGPSQSVAFAVKNPGSGSQILSTVAVTVATATGATWASTPVGCTAADFTVGTPVITYGEVAAAGIVNGTVSITMKNTGVNQDACKNLTTVPLYFTVG